MAGDTCFYGRFKNFLNTWTDIPFGYFFSANNYCLPTNARQLIYSGMAGTTYVSFSHMQCFSTSQPAQDYLLEWVKGGLVVARAVVQKNTGMIALESGTIPITNELYQVYVTGNYVPPCDKNYTSDVRLVARCDNGDILYKESPVPNTFEATVGNCFVDAAMIGKNMPTGVVKEWLLRSVTKGYMRFGTYTVIAKVAGTLIPLASLVVTAMNVYQIMETVEPLARSLMDSSDFQGFTLSYDLATASCPPGEPNGVISQWERDPLPPTEYVPEPWEAPDTPDPGSTIKPVGLDDCCSYLGDCMDGIKSALYAQNAHVDAHAHLIDLRFAELTARVSGIWDTLKSIQADQGASNEDLKAVLQDIAKSLVVGYDDPDGIKERIADICAAFLNLIDSRRG